MSQPKEHKPTRLPDTPPVIPGPHAPECSFPCTAICPCICHAHPGEHNWHIESAEETAYCTVCGVIACKLLIPKAGECILPLGHRGPHRDANFYSYYSRRP